MDPFKQYRMAELPKNEMEMFRIAPKDEMEPYRIGSAQPDATSFSPYVDYSLPEAPRDPGVIRQLPVDQTPYSWQLGRGMERYNQAHNAIKDVFDENILDPRHREEALDFYDRISTEHPVVAGLGQTFAGEAYDFTKDAVTDPASVVAAPYVAGKSGLQMAKNTGRMMKGLRAGDDVFDAGRMVAADVGAQPMSKVGDMAGVRVLDDAPVAPAEVPVFGKSDLPDNFMGMMPGKGTTVGKSAGKSGSSPMAVGKSGPIDIEDYRDEYNVYKLENSGVTSLGSLKYVDGGLDLGGTDITDLGSLESVGYLNLRGTPLTDLGSLKYVDNLELGGSSVSNLGSLEHVNTLGLHGTPLADLGSLKTVRGNLDLRSTGVDDLGSLEYVGGKIFTGGSNTYSFPELKGLVKEIEDSPISDLIERMPAEKDPFLKRVIERSIRGIDDAPAEAPLFGNSDLPDNFMGMMPGKGTPVGKGTTTAMGKSGPINIEDYMDEYNTFGRSYNLDNTDITSLGSLKSVEGHLGLKGTPITSLGSLKSVGRGLNLRRTPITSLGSLESVGGDLFLGGTPITDLGSLKSVGDFLDLKGTPITSLGSLKSVGGGLKLVDSDITSLGSLESVGGWMDLYGTPITDLGSLKSVGGSLHLEGTDITSLGSLESVGGYLNLADTPITDLGSLKSVDGDLNLSSTLIDDLGSLEHVGGDYIFTGGTRSYSLPELKGLIQEIKDSPISDLVERLNYEKDPFLKRVILRNIKDY